MIKIPKINEANVRAFYNDVKKSYLNVLESFKNDKNSKKIISYFYKNGKIYENKVEEVIIGNRNVLEKVIGKIGVIENNDELNKEFERIYKNFTQRNLGRNWAKKIDVKICPYCNRSFIFTTTQKGTRPQYDHYFPKSKYPYLAVSLYNLIPCCSICNNAKKAEDTFNNNSLLYPFEEEYGYDIFFDIETNDELCYLGVSDDFRITIRSEDSVEKDFVRKIQKSSEILHLEDLYNLHKDHVLKLLRSKYIFTDDYCRSILDSYQNLFCDINEVKNQLYFNYLQKEDWGEQILSKLTYDILNIE